MHITGTSIFAQCLPYIKNKNMHTRIHTHIHTQLIPLSIITKINKLMKTCILFVTEAFVYILGNKPCQIHDVM